MSGEVVRSPRNSRVAAAAALHRRRTRRERGETLIEGPHLLAAAATGGALIDIVFALPEDGAAAAWAELAGADLVTVTTEVLARVAPTQHPRGPVAVAAIPEPLARLDTPCLVLWGIDDPGNAGTLIRTAAAFGLGVVTVAGTVDLWSPKVLRAGAGAHFATAIARLDGADPARLGEWGLRTVATVARGGSPPAALGPSDRPRAVLVGDEARGLPPEVAAAADERVTIPMPGGAESLNAAAAGAIVAYELFGRA